MYRDVARPERLELPTLGFEGRCSIQLSYGRVGAIVMERPADPLLRRRTAAGRTAEVHDIGAVGQRGPHQRAARLTAF